MRDLFPGYYSPTEDEYKKLWNEGLIVLDTNVLLNLYRLPTSARNEFISVLEKIKDNLWIPHQVALEFQRNRLTVITTERKSTDTALKESKDFINKVRSIINSLELDKRELDIKSAPLLENIQQTESAIIDAISKTHEAKLDISTTDSIRDKIDEILNNRIGEAPFDQAALDQLTSAGEDRFTDKIPPGFLDAEKDKNPNGANFIFNGIKYQRKFGDLILWRQIIKYAKEANKESVLLITGDQKEDWWRIEQGKTISPHPELMAEIKRETSVKHFWMYSSTQFLQQAKNHIEAEISDTSIEEVQQIETTQSNDFFKESTQPSTNKLISKIQKRMKLLSPQYISSFETEKAIEAWIIMEYGNTHFSHIPYIDLSCSTSENIEEHFIIKTIDLDNIVLTEPSRIISKINKYIQDEECENINLIINITNTGTEKTENDKKLKIQAIASVLSKHLKNNTLKSIIIGEIINSEFNPTLIIEGNSSYRIAPDSFL